MNDTEKPIAISLTIDQALVIHEMCNRTLCDGQPLRLRNGAEYQALRAMQDEIAERLPLGNGDYPERLFAARARLEESLEELPGVIEPYGAGDTASVPASAPLANVVPHTTFAWRRHLLELFPEHEDTLRNASFTDALHKVERHWYAAIDRGDKSTVRRVVAYRMWLPSLPRPPIDFLYEALEDLAMMLDARRRSLLFPDLTRSEFEELRGAIWYTRVSKEPDLDLDREYAAAHPSTPETEPPAPHSGEPTT
jgi:hypothetical protein